MKSIIATLLLFFVIAGNSIEDKKNDDAIIELPSYNDALRENILHNTEDIPPPEYEEALTRDYKYNRLTEEIEIPPEEHVDNTALLYNNKNLKNLKYVAYVMLGIGFLSIVVTILQYAIHKYKNAS